VGLLDRVVDHRLAVHLAGKLVITPMQVAQQRRLARGELLQLGELGAEKLTYFVGRTFST